MPLVSLPRPASVRACGLWAVLRQCAQFLLVGYTCCAVCMCWQQCVCMGWQQCAPFLLVGYTCILHSMCSLLTTHAVLCCNAVELVLATGPLLRGALCTHLFPRSALAKDMLPAEELQSNDSQRPHILCLHHYHRTSMCPDCPYNFRRRIGEAESHWGNLPDAGGAAKVDERPAALRGQPHDVAGLDVAMDVSCCMQVLQPLNDVDYHLHKGHSLARDDGSPQEEARITA